MAYKSKYYDPVKAHEYYLKHRKLKGKTNTQRGSTASLNDAGKVAAAEVKEQLQAELKAALAKLPKRGATEARKQLRAQYQEKYYAELDQIRADSGFAKVKQTKAASSKSTGSKSTGTTRAAKSTAAGTQQKTTATKTAKAKKTAAQVALEGMAKINSLTSALDSLTDDQKSAMKDKINSMIEKITKKLQKNLLSNTKTGSVKSVADVTSALSTISKLQKNLEKLPADSKQALAPRVQNVIDRLTEKVGGKQDDKKTGGPTVTYTVARKTA